MTCLCAHVPRLCPRLPPPAPASCPALAPTATELSTPAKARNAPHKKKTSAPPCPHRAPEQAAPAAQPLNNLPVPPPCRNATPSTFHQAGVRGSGGVWGTVRSPGGVPAGCRPSCQSFTPCCFLTTALTAVIIPQHVGWREGARGPAAAQRSAARHTVRPSPTVICPAPPTCRASKPAWSDAPQEERAVLHPCLHHVRMLSLGVFIGGGGGGGAGPGRKLWMPRGMAAPAGLRAGFQSSHAKRVGAVVQAAQRRPSQAPDAPLCASHALAALPATCSQYVNATVGHQLACRCPHTPFLPAARACAPPPVPRCGLATCQRRPAPTSPLRWAGQGEQRDGAEVQGEQGRAARW